MHLKLPGGVVGVGVLGGEGPEEGGQHSAAVAATQCLHKGHLLPGTPPTDDTCLKDNKHMTLML